MTTPLTVATLFDTLQAKLALSWVAGQNGRHRTIRYEPGDDRTNISLVGHLNFIHPHRIQLIGETEHGYLTGLRKNSRKDAINQLLNDDSDLIIVCDNLAPPD
ncbi:MAG: HPr(Ser) kinase/phosphatase, partial [Gammaproteobacteria bacterium]|nr:HPr(Ser) kinase/phosphatase [Gammaproteobacteria bacterium]